VSRAIGYFIEPLLILAPFGKYPLELEIKGVTNDNIDTSVDCIRTVLLPQLSRFGVEENMELRILKRGARPNGGGLVRLRLPVVRKLKACQFTETGLVKKIRGIAYCTRTSPQMANRVQEASRSILTRYIPDVYIYTDVFKGQDSGLSPGYALTLVAETDTQAIISAECAFKPRKDLSKGQECAEMLTNDYTFPTPEDLGVRTARQLMLEIKKNASVDTVSQWLNLGMIALGPEDVGKIRVGTLSRFS
jgi:RNA 3'-terminal phosphate cyclase-like protein